MKDCCKEALQNEELNTGGALSDTQTRQKPLERLRQKWQVKNIVQVVLILCTFAIGGSICGYLGRKILNLTGMESGALWVVTYFVLVTILWPACVLAISVFFGQYKFFKGYLMRMGARMFGKKKVSSELPTE